jgi:hypothetical protein
MTAWCRVLAALVSVLWALPVRTEELTRPLTAVEWVTLGTMSRFGAYAEVCTRHMPGGRVTWERALANISATVDRLTGEQLATARFAGIDEESLPAASSAELRHSIDGARSKLATRLATQDPDINCPQFLRNAQGFDDDALRPIVIDALAGFKAMLMVQKGGQLR